MPCTSTVELHDLVLACRIGSYGPGDVIPDRHLLDLSLEIDPSRVLAARDSMEAVFDYDPLIAEIDRIARDGHYETQEWLMTRIVGACARFAEVRAVSLFLRKGPVLNDSGTLGVRLTVDARALSAFR